MKKKDVPQDDDFSYDGKYREITYALGEEGRYEQVLSSGWRPKNEALKFAWTVIDRQVRNAGRQVISGKLSPIAYHMEKNIMDLKILAQYMGLSKRIVKRHLQPKEFEKLNRDWLARYADIFNISVETLLDVHQIKEELLAHED